MEGVPNLFNPMSTPPGSNYQVIKIKYFCTEDLQIDLYSLYINQKSGFQPL